MITTMPSDQNGPPPRVEVITSVQRRRRALPSSFVVPRRCRQLARHKRRGKIKLTEAT
jgi:hypothetical protein